MKKNDEEYNDLVDKYDQVKDRLEQCYEVLSAKNKSIPVEESQDIRNVARAFLKDVLFQAHQLLKSWTGEELDQESVRRHQERNGF